MFFPIQDIYYNLIYNSLIALLSFVVFFYYFNSSGQKVLTIGKTGSEMSLFFSLVISIFLILFIGLRPISLVFVDTGEYAGVYNNLINEYVDIDFSKEWLFHNLSYFCKVVGLDASGYFLVISFLYVGLMLLTCILYMRRNVLVALLFCVASFSFYSYGVNGIRNGLACSIALLAIPLLSGNIFNKIASFILMLSAYSIHHSIMLPFACAIFVWISRIKSKFAIIIWFSAILLSLIMGNVFGDFFADQGFSRSSYFDFEENFDSNSIAPGFRFDFLLYSSMPILMIAYINIKRNFNDVTYNIISNTYILANAFWVLVIRNVFSNRFAYLSWFLYPIVIVYPLLRMNIWDDQDRKAALILLFYAGFTIIMNLVYYG